MSDETSINADVGNRDDLELGERVAGGDEYDDNAGLVSIAGWGVSEDSESKRRPL